MTLVGENGSVFVTPTLLILLATPQLPPVARTAARTPILTYHDMVSVRDSRALWFDCTPAELEAQLDWLQKRGARFVSLKAVEEHLKGRKALPKNAVAITFADNYEGFYNLALPILRRRRVPVTMFVHTDFVGNRRGRPKMSWGQLEELDREGLVTIASQTRSHPADLRTLSDAKLREEMTGSKRALEARLGHDVAYIAYPNGKYDARVAKAAHAAGYRLGFTEAQKPAERAPNLFTVPRYVHTKYRQAWADAR
jgi:peptidoglycan/xylan/chitin deacetylase (PgdA/CDA1 family)